MGDLLRNCQNSETVKTTKMRDLLGPVASTFGAALARLPQVACIPLPPALAVTRADDSVAPTPKPKRKLSSASARLEKWCVRPVPVPRACAFRPPPQIHGWPQSRI